MNNTARRFKITVSCDGQGIVSQAGASLLAETARVTGLGEGPDRRTGPVAGPAGGA